jgi:hypothetical protein
MSDDEMIVYTSTPHAQARANELHNECLNAALPYSALLEDEGVRSLSLSLGGLRSAVAIGDLQRGTNFHCAALRRTISLKHELTDAMRAESIRLIYALVTADIDLQLSMRRTWCGLLCKLLRRAKHLHLNLPWRPMFDKLDPAIAKADKLMATADESLQSIKKAADTFSAVGANISSGKGLLGALMNDQRLMTDFRDLIYNFKVNGPLWYKDTAEKLRTEEAKKQLEESPPKRGIFR